MSTGSIALNHSWLPDYMKENLDFSGSFKRTVMGTLDSYTFNSGVGKNASKNALAATSTLEVSVSSGGMSPSGIVTAAYYKTAWIRETT